MLSKKIDFAIIFSVKDANPNGDPLNGNRPRTNYEGRGEITDVCLKRKIRDRLMENNVSIFVQSDENKKDAATSLANRAETRMGKDFFGKKNKKEDIIKKVCEEWYDVRAFGQVFAFKGDAADGVSVPVRGPVTIQSAFSVDPVDIISIQITKSVNSVDTKDGKKSSDTMGMKHRVTKGVYVTYGSINPQLAERTGFDDKDVETFKAILPKIFENDASSARPDGSMKVEKVLWWEHNCKSGQYSSARVHGTLHVDSIGEYELDRLEGLEPEEIEGF